MPPFSYQGLFRAEANGRDEVQLFLGRLAETLRSAQYPHVQVLGPISGFMERKAGKFRMQLLVQGPNRAPLAQLLDWAVKELDGWPETKKVRWSLDIDPTELN
ncbi:Primosomal protein N' [compost metagenome]